MKNRLSQSPGHLLVVGPATCLALFLMLTVPARAVERQILSAHVPPAVAKLSLQPTGQVPATNRLHLAISLPLRNKEVLTNLLQRLYDPASTNFHRYLTPQQFTEQFGPLEQDYQKVIDFAKTNGLAIDGTSGNRLLLDVSGKVSEIERAFQVTLRTYRHPTENREFFAPDVEPSVDVRVPILNISGLDTFFRPHSNLHRIPTKSPATANDFTGSGPGHNYIGSDFRNAYVPGVTLDGTGQQIGLVEFDNFCYSSLNAYQTLAGLPAVTVYDPTADGPWFGFNGANVEEVSLDIDMVMSMAPGAVVWVIKGNLLGDIMNYAVSNPQIKQFSCSYNAFTIGTLSFSTSIDQQYMELEAQGQSMFQSSGDKDANTIAWPSDDPYVTVCGGTTLAMNGSGASYASETVWNWGGGVGSCGGVSGTYPIPYYQQGVNMTAVGGSTTMRNVPDVALTADNVWVIYNNSENIFGNFSCGNSSDQVATEVGGTSCAAPLWAAFTALVNQQAAANGQPSVGFLNPAIYYIGKGSRYASDFHDIVTGNNTSSSSPNQYYAFPGYDLTTGWGTPAGQSLIDDLISYSGTWVDFNYTGSTQNGSYDAPFKTLAQGVTAVSIGGTIWIKSTGSSPETPTITRPMTIRAYNGSATIGL